MITDIQMACDVLKSVYDRTKGRDGYVSVEVSPDNARNTQATVKVLSTTWTIIASNVYCSGMFGRRLMRLAPSYNRRSHTRAWMNSRHFVTNVMGAEYSQKEEHGLPNTKGTFQRSASLAQS